MSKIDDRSTERCAPFCANRASHAADPSADDGDCWSRFFSTALNSTPWVASFPVIADVVAHRSADAEDAVVAFVLRSSGHYDAKSVQFTPAEARRVAAHLVHVAGLVDGGDR